MDLAVVIPALNCEKEISGQIKALCRQKVGFSWEIVVVDNGSTDKTFTNVLNYSEKVPNLRVIQASSRQGSAFARNIGVRNTQAEVIAFCDADDEVCDDWLENIFIAVKKLKFVVGPRSFSKLNCDSRVKSHREYSTKQENLFVFRFPPYLNHGSACNMAILRYIHESVGGFDENCRFNQDLEYCLRIQKAGYSLHFVPEAVIEYRLKKTLLGAYNQKRRWGKYYAYVARKHCDDIGLLHRLRFLFGGVRYFPSNISRIRNRSTLFEFVEYLGGKVGEIQGYFQFLLF